MKAIKIKLLVIAIFTLPVFALAVFNTSAVRAVASPQEDVVKTYKTKCLACHGPTAAKFYDPAMAEEEQIEVILKGKKGEKPPFMPAYEPKGMTAEQAKELVDHMKQLAAPPE